MNIVFAILIVATTGYQGERLFTLVVGFKGRGRVKRLKKAGFLFELLLEVSKWFCELTQLVMLCLLRSKHTSLFFYILRRKR